MKVPADGRGWMLAVPLPEVNRAVSSLVEPVSRLSAPIPAAVPGVSLGLEVAKLRRRVRPRGTELPESRQA